MSVIRRGFQDFGICIISCGVEVPSAVILIVIELASINMIFISLSYANRAYMTIQTGDVARHDRSECQHDTYEHRWRVICHSPIGGLVKVLNKALCDLPDVDVCGGGP
jgi:hypothetical protein